MFPAAEAVGDTRTNGAGPAPGRSTAASLVQGALAARDADKRTSAPCTFCARFGFRFCAWRRARSASRGPSRCTSAASSGRGQRHRPRRAERQRVRRAVRGRRLDAGPADEAGSMRAFTQNPAIRQQLIWIGLWFVLGAFIGFDNYAHGGGAVRRALRVGAHGRPGKKRRWRGGGVRVAALLVLASLRFALTRSLRGRRRRRRALSGRLTARGSPSNLWYEPPHGGREIHAEALVIGQARAAMSPASGLQLKKRRWSSSVTKGGICRNVIASRQGADQRGQDLTTSSATAVTSASSRTTSASTWSRCRAGSRGGQQAHRRRQDPAQGERLRLPHGRGAADLAQHRQPRRRTASGARRPGRQHVVATARGRRDRASV